MTELGREHRRERQKLEQGPVEADWKADRHAAGAEPDVARSHRSEVELIEDLAACHRGLEAGELSAEKSGERRDRIQAKLEQLS